MTKNTLFTLIVALLPLVSAHISNIQAMKAGEEWKQSMMVETAPCIICSTPLETMSAHRVCDTCEYRPACVRCVVNMLPPGSLKCPLCQESFTSEERKRIRKAQRGADDTVDSDEKPELIIAKLGDQSYWRILLSGHQNQIITTSYGQRPVVQLSPYQYHQLHDSISIPACRLN